MLNLNHQLHRSTMHSFIIIGTMRAFHHRGLRRRPTPQYRLSAACIARALAVLFRAGLWDDSIASNLAAREAAHQQGDTEQELHAMDYLVYAYLQSGRNNEAAQVVQQLKNMPDLNAGDFILAYAATAMPARYTVERGQWSDAASIVPLSGAPPQVVALAVWARGMGLARSGRAPEAHVEIDKVRQIKEQLHTSGNDYWASQVGIQGRSYGVDGPGEQETR